MLIKNADVTVRAEEDGLYLAYNRRLAIPLVMNNTSHFIWDRCSQAADVDSLVKELSAHYSIQDSSLTAERLQTIILEHIKLLKGVGLLLDPSADSLAVEAAAEVQ